MTNPWFFDDGVDGSSEVAANDVKQTSAFVLPGNVFREALEHRQTMGCAAGFDVSFFSSQPPYVEGPGAEGGHYSARLEEWPAV